MDIPNPNVVLVTFVVCFTFIGGYISGIVSGLLIIIYSLIFFSCPGDLFTFNSNNLQKVVVAAIFIPVMILIVGNLKNQLTKKTKDLELANEKLNFSSIHDFLTGIPNRRYFDEVINNEWINALHKRDPISIAIIDIDYFKKFNDTYGHISGDNCLKEVAKAIMAESNRAGYVTARYGGEEFAVIIPNDNAKEIAENIRKSVENLQISHKSSMVSKYLTVSVGLATIVPFNENGYSGLLDMADAALYCAKEKGRNRVEIFKEQHLRC